MPDSAPPRDSPPPSYSAPPRDTTRPPDTPDAPATAATEPESELVAFARQVFDLARAGSAELLELIDHGVPVSLTDAAGNTLVMLAAYHGHAALVAGLAERGADVNAANDRGQTPLAGAVFKATPDVIASLVRFGADPDLGAPSARATAEYFQRPDLLQVDS